MCIAILTDPPFIPTHRNLMNHADEYYVKGVYHGVVCCCFFLFITGVIIHHQHAFFSAMTVI